MTPNPDRDPTTDCWRIWLACLGVVFHAVYLYPTQTLHATALRQSWQWIFWTYLSNIMHAFRVPMFFIISGYSARIVLQNKGIKYLINNRYQRILKPLICLCLCMNITLISGTVAMILVALVSSQHTWAIVCDALAGVQLFHLWFLWYLLLMTILDCVMTPIAAVISKKIRQEPIPIGWAVISCAVVGSQLDAGGHFWSYYPNHLAFDLKHFCYSLQFYMVGRLYPMAVMRTHVKKHQKLYYGCVVLSLALLLFTRTAVVLPSDIARLVQSTLVWLTCVVLLASTEMICKTPLVHLCTFSKSAYWIYLIHLPCILWLYQIYPPQITQHPSWCIVLTTGLSFYMISRSFWMLKRWSWFSKHIATDAVTAERAPYGASLTSVLRQRA